MNWFQRYGMPGAYFFVLTMAWVIALSDLTIKNIDSETGDIIVALAVITFLPLGYIISIFQQWFYYRFAPLGMHKIAKSLALFDLPVFFDSSDEEPDIEADSINPMWDDDQVTLYKRKFFNEWFRRRMDVVAINFSLYTGTLLSPIIAITITITYLEWEHQLNQVYCVAAISLLLLMIIIGSMKVLRGQIIRVLVHVYQRQYQSLTFQGGWIFILGEITKKNKEVTEIKDKGITTLIYFYIYFVLIIAIVFYYALFRM
jgi:hypothetical protein